MVKLGIIVQRYGLEINGGAEYHARLIAEKLAPFFEIEVFTSTALDYITWEQHFPAGCETLNGIKVTRFDVEKNRDPVRFGAIQQKVFTQEHSLEDELLWLEEEGPFLPGLLKELERRESEFDYFIFFSYRYYHSYHGIRRFKKKALLVPTAEHDEVVYLRLFKSLFNQPAGIFYNSIEERDMIQRISGNQRIPGIVVGIGSEIPDQIKTPTIHSNRGLERDYCLYIGRLDENKGVPRLLDYYTRLKKEAEPILDLVLVGKTWIDIPEDESIKYLGFLDNSEKFTVLNKAKFLIIPSQYESLSMVTLEAWAIGKAVVANGRTEVLKGQCRRSNAGLWYSGYEEFREIMLLLMSHPDLVRRLGENGRYFFESNYSWPVIEQKYLDLIAEISSP